MRHLIQVFRTSGTQLGGYLKESEIATDSAFLLIDKMKKLTADFKPEFSGWGMKHSYRARSLSGNTGIHHYIYVFNKELTKLVDHEDISSEDEHGLTRF